MPRLTLRSSLPLVLTAGLLGVVPVALAGPAHASGYTHYRPTCDTTTYTVPPGVTLLTTTVYGESGRPGTPGAYSAGAGGRGGKVEVTLPVTPGQQLWAAPNSKIMRGGGEYSYGIGGNGSLVTSIDPAPYCGTGETLPREAIVVAAGGGGGGADGDTGTGGSGGDAGAYGGNGGNNDKKDGAGGAPGTQTDGGAGGNNGSYPFANPGQPGRSGSYLRGGAGGFDGPGASAYEGAEPTPQMNAGGGGGGFYGGGGGGGAANGAAAGGGGGGSNYVSPSVPTTAPTRIFQAGVRVNGTAEYVDPRVDFVPVYTSTTSTIRTPLNPIHEGNPVTLSVTVTRNDGGFPQGGAVEFLDGNNVVATGQVDSSSGVASVSVSTLAPGVHQIQARFTGARLSTQQVETSWAENPNDQPLRLVVDAAFRPVAPVITKDPVGEPKLYSSSGHFDAQATGNPTPSVQWQESPNNGRNWGDIQGATDRQLVVAASVAKTGHQYRAVFTNSAGRAVTKAATMTVLREPMPVVPVDASMFPGSDVPALSASYPHFTPRFGRTLAEEVTKAPKCTTTATSHSPVGTYPITCSGAVMPNYDPEYRTGTLTVAAHSHATSFTVPHALTGWYAGDWIHLTAQGGADDNPVEFSIDHGTPAWVCELHGATLELSPLATSGQEECLVTAKQPGVSHAPPVTRAVRIHQPHRNAMLLAPATGAVGETAVLTAHGYLVDGETSTPTSHVEVTRRHHDSAVCTVTRTGDVITVHYLAVGHCTVHAQQPQAPGRAGGTTERIAVHAPTPQEVRFTSSFPAAPEAGTTVEVAATGRESGPAVTLGTETPAVCAFRGSTLHLLARGSCTAVATQAGGGGYSVGVARQTIAVTTNSQIVFFPPASARVGSTITLSATKVPYGRPPVGFSVSTASGAGVCSLSGAVLTLRSAGSCVVVATQPHAGEFLGSRVQRTITVTP